MLYNYTTKEERACFFENIDSCGLQSAKLALIVKVSLLFARQYNIVLIKLQWNLNWPDFDRVYMCNSAFVLSKIMIFQA
jgi:hypothetical protein